MNEILCFKINDISLFLDKVLVSFNEVPIFFICKDRENKYYLVMCEDIDSLKYMIVNQSIIVIYKMLNQEISMRAALLYCDNFWEVESGNTIDEDEVTFKNYKEINLNILPEEDAMYKPLNEDDNTYIDRIHALIYNSLFIEELRKRISVIEEPVIVRKESTRMDHVRRNTYRRRKTAERKRNIRFDYNSDGLINHIPSDGVLC